MDNIKQNYSLFPRSQTGILMPAGDIQIISILKRPDLWDKPWKYCVMILKYVFLLHFVPVFFFFFLLRDYNWTENETNCNCVRKMLGVPSWAIQPLIYKWKTKGT